MATKNAPPWLVVGLALGSVVLGCGGSVSAGKPDAQAEAQDATSGGSCGSLSCAAGEYCFHAWAGTCSTNTTTCSTDCPCTCGSLPASCPASMPCTCPGSGGYFGNPGEVFSSPDAAGDAQVICYGS